MFASSHLPEHGMLNHWEIKVTEKIPKRKKQKQKQVSVTVCFRLQTSHTFKYVGFCFVLNCAAKPLPNPPPIHKCKSRNTIIVWARSRKTQPPSDTKCPKPCPMAECMRDEEALCHPSTGLGFLLNNSSSVGATSCPRPLHIN